MPDVQSLAIVLIVLAFPAGGLASKALMDYRKRKNRDYSAVGHLFDEPELR